MIFCLRPCVWCPEKKCLLCFLKSRIKPAPPFVWAWIPSQMFSSEDWKDWLFKISYLFAAAFPPLPDSTFAYTAGWLSSFCSLYGFHRLWLHSWHRDHLCRELFETLSCACLLCLLKMRHWPKETESIVKRRILEQWQLFDRNSVFRGKEACFCLGSTFLRGR